MGKATMSFLNGVCNYNKQNHILRAKWNSSVRIIWVTDFKDGIATVLQNDGCDIDDFALAISGCFKRKSKFREKLLKTFECDKNVRFKGIKFTFDGVTVVVTKKSSDVETIITKWRNAFETKKIN